MTIWPSLNLMESMYPDTGAHLDGFERREPSGIFVPLGDLLLQRTRDGDEGRAGSAAVGGRLVRNPPKSWVARSRPPRKWPARQQLGSSDHPPDIADRRTGQASTAIY